MDPLNPVGQSISRFLTWREGRMATAIMLALVLLVLAMGGWHVGLQSRFFDNYQKIWPRERTDIQVLIVEIDEKSLSQEGQWPWPRTRMATLIDEIGLAGPLAIGIDILFPEPDRLSPANIADLLPQLPETDRNALRSLPNNDDFLADALALSPSVLAMAGLPTGEGKVDIPGQPIRLPDGQAFPPSLPHFSTAVQSMAILRQSAPGQGMINGYVDSDGVYRRPVIVAKAGDKPVGSMAVEMLRQALQLPYGMISKDHGRDGVTVTLGGYDIPVEADGGYRLHFARSVDEIYISAADIFAGKADMSLFKDRFVLIGPTGVGIKDVYTVPTGDAMAGVEIHAQLLESLLDDAALKRPVWFSWIEWCVILAAGIALVWLAPRLYAVQAIGGSLISAILVFVPGPITFVAAGLVVDSLIPALGILAVGVALTASRAAVAAQDEQLLLAEVQRQREESARLKGELEAARKIQLGLLPSAEQVAYGEHRLDLSAYLEPAREVGGDLYDLFYINSDTLFFMVGDVSGKGVPASLFMAISKAIYKNAVLRRQADIGDIMTEANAEIARDNPELLFITLFAGVLDLRSGELQYCNAGHDNPLLLSAQGALLDRLADAGGPPLCVMDDWEYESATITLKVTQSLLISTDGITEAMDHDGALYSQERMEHYVGTHMEGAKAVQVINGLLEDVQAHCKGAPPSDDTTVMMIRFLGDAETPGFQD